ncbi:glycosyl hydrolase [Sorangium sp. So ce296]
MCNDHHFHYGYLINAAAMMALRDPAWGARPPTPLRCSRSRDTATATPT